MQTQHKPAHSPRWTKRLTTLILLIFTVQCTASPARPPLPPTPSKPTLTIAILSPASGELETFGRTMRNGIIMAFEQWNEWGGAGGQHLAWQIYDTQCDFKAAQQATQQAIADGRQYLIGPLCSEAALGAAVVAEQHGALLISPTATHPLVTIGEQGHTRPAIFTIAASWEQQGTAAARFATQTLKSKRAALLLPPNDEYARLTSAAFADTFIRTGGEVIQQVILPLNQAELTETLNKIAQAGVEIVYLPAPAAEANRVAPNLADTSLLLLGSDRWDSPALDPTLSQGHYFTSHFSLTTAQSIAWATRYKATYAIEPDTLAALGFDGAMIFASALDQSNRFTVEDITRTLETTDFALNSGSLRFNEQHQSLKPIPIIRIGPNGYEFIDTISP